MISNKVYGQKKYVITATLACGGGMPSTEYLCFIA